MARSGPRPGLLRPGPPPPVTLRWAVPGALGALAALGFFLLLVPGVASAQEVRGKLVEAGGGAPVEGALVRLVGQAGAGAEAPTALSGPEGGFRLVAPGPGVYRVEVERIGFETWRSGELELAAAATRRRR